VYRVERAVVVDALVQLLSRKNLQVHELPRERAIEGLLLCRDSGRVSFADAMIWAAARDMDNAQVFTFDRRFPGRDVDLQLLA